VQGWAPHHRVFPVGGGKELLAIQDSIAVGVSSIEGSRSIRIAQVSKVRVRTITAQDSFDRPALAAGLAHSLRQKGGEGGSERVAGRVAVRRC